MSEFKEKLIQEEDITEEEDIKCTNSSSLNIHNELFQNRESSSIEEKSLLDVSAEKFDYYSIDIIKGLNSIAECNHYALYGEYDTFQDLRQTFLHTKSMEMAQKIDIGKTEYWEFRIENCTACPMQQREIKTDQR